MAQEDDERQLVKGAGRHGSHARRLGRQDAHLHGPEQVLVKNLVKALVKRGVEWRVKRVGPEGWLGVRGFKVTLEWVSGAGF